MSLSQGRCTALHGNVRHYAALCDTVRHYTTLYDTVYILPDKCTALRDAARHYTALHDTSTARLTCDAHPATCFQRYRTSSGRVRFCKMMRVGFRNTTSSTAALNVTSLNRHVPLIFKRGMIIGRSLTRQDGRGPLFLSRIAYSKRLNISVSCEHPLM